jgi:hypothetical protein
VNKYQAGDSNPALDTLEVDNSAVRAAQVARLEGVTRSLELITVLTEKAGNPHNWFN